MSVRKDSIQVSVDISPAQEGVKQFQGMLDRTKELNSEMRKLKRAGKENTDEFKKLKKESDELSKSFAKFDLSTARMGQLEKRSKDLARAIRYQLTPGTKEFVTATKEFKKVNQRLAEVRKEAGFTKDALNEIRIAGIKVPDGIAKGMNGVQTAFKAFLALQVIQYFVEMFQVVDETTKQFVKLRGSVKDLTGETGRELDEFTVRLSAISTTFEKENDEVLRATNALAKQMGIGFGDALDIVEKGFLGGVDRGGEFLDMLREYPVFFKEAGLSAEQALAVMSQSVEDGVFSDKGPDLIKEFNLRIREMPKVTRDALNAIGLDSRAVAKEIDQNGIGGAFTLVQSKLKGLEADSPAVGQALADIFGGPGEDAGIQFIQTLDLTDNALDNLIDTGNEYTRQMIAQLQANEELAEAQNEVSKKFSETSGSLGVYVTQVRTFLFRVAGSILDFFTQLPATVEGVQAAFRQMFDNIENFFNRTYITLQIAAKKIEKLNPFGKTSEQLNQEIEALRTQRGELAEEGQSVAQAYRTAMLGELDKIQERQKVVEALLPSVPENQLRAAAATNAKRVTEAYDEELAKAQANRASQPGAVSGLGASTLPTSVSSTGEAVEDTSAQDERLKNKFLQALLTEQQYEDRRFEMQQLNYERRLEFLREKFGEESAAYIELENKKLTAQQQYEAQRQESTRLTEEARRTFQEQGLQALSGFVGDTISLLQEEEAGRKRNAAALKAFSIGKVIIDTQEAILAIQKNAEANPGNILFPGLAKIIAGVKIAGVLIKSTSALQKIRKTGFYDGGFTGATPLFKDNQGRDVVGGVHKNEWVAPEWQTKHPTYGPIIGWLDNMRKNGYQEGGFANATGVAPAAGGADFSFMQKALDQLTASQQEMTEAIRRKQFAVNTGQLRDALDDDYILDSKSSF